MPRNDRTGPNGSGPMTGRQMGICTGNTQTRNAGWFAGFSGGRGVGLGRKNVNRRNIGRGGGYGRGFEYRSDNYINNNPTNTNDKTLIENELVLLKEQMTKLEKKLSELNKND